MSPRRPESREETPKEGICGRSCRTATICACVAAKASFFCGGLRCFQQVRRFCNTHFDAANLGVVNNIIRYNGLRAATPPPRAQPPNSGHDRYASDANLFRSFGAVGMTAVDFAGFVDRLAQVSGEVILPFFRSTIGAEDKSRGGVFDPVTEADRGAEAAMRRLIAQTFPAHGVIGEEYGQDRPDAEYVWVLDPIDGTKSFISGLPTWGTLIGLMHRGKPVYGMMAQPFTRERFFGDGKRTRLRCLAPSRGDAPPSEWVDAGACARANARASPRRR